MRTTPTTAAILLYSLLPCLAQPPAVPAGAPAVAASPSARQPAPQWLENALFYQLYPQSFKDSDGDGIGDIRGIIAKLDYIKSLGCDAIWMNPCFESAFRDAGYDVMDYCKVAPRYGSNQDLETLFREAHDRGIRICLDLVAGHTSDQHEWFKKSRRKDGIYSDRYIWTPDPQAKDAGYVFDGTERHEYFMKNFFDCQPAINYGFAHPQHAWEQPVDSPAARASRDELFRIMDFWMSRGADGFRVDMASSLIKRDSDFAETDKLWSWIRGKFQQKYPQGVLISEWGNPEQAVRAGFMIDFMIHFGVKGYPSLFFNEEGVFHRQDCYFSAGGKGSAGEFVESYMKQLKAVDGQGYVSVPTANHDIQRPRSGGRDSEEQLKVVMTFLLTLKGIPFIYYGDEIGMRFVSPLSDKEGSLLRGMNDIYGNPLGNRAGSRLPMQWTRGANAGFSATATAPLYLPIDPQATDNNVEDQARRAGSLLNLTKALSRLRKENTALGNTGAIEFLHAADPAYPLVYTRKSGDAAFLIAINPSGKDSVAQIALDPSRSYAPVLNEGTEVRAGDGKLTIHAARFSYGIFRISNSKQP